METITDMQEDDIEHDRRESNAGNGPDNITLCGLLRGICRRDRNHLTFYDDVALAPRLDH